jgi:hypothetical protein
MNAGFFVCREEQTMTKLPEAMPLFSGQSELPDDINDGLTKGGLYSIRIESAPTRLSLLTHAIVTNLAREIRCTLISRLTLDEFLAHSGQKETEIFLNAIEERKLTVFSMVGDYAKNLFRFGAERFLYELEQFRIPNDSFIVIDHADSLFIMEDRAIASIQARAYREWMQKTGNVALFVFLPAVENDSHHAYFQGISDHFSGLAGLYIGRNGLELGIDFWTLQGGIILAKHVGVKTEDGQIDVAPSLTVNRRIVRRPRNEEKTDNVFEFTDMNHPRSDDSAEQAGAQDTLSASPVLSARQWNYRAIRRRSRHWIFDPRLRHTKAQRRARINQSTVRLSAPENTGHRYRFHAN